MMSLHILSDNTTAVSSVNWFGTTKYPIRQQILTNFATIFRQRQLSITIAHLAGSLNVCADALSRNVSSLPSEATLSNEKFAQLCLKTGTRPEIDLFASPWNRKCPLFSPLNQNLKFQVADSLLINWSILKTAYAFPPPRLIPKTIFKWLKEGKGTLLLVTPKWKKMVWFAHLQKIAKKWVQGEIENLALFINASQGQIPCHLRPSCLIG